MIYITLFFALIFACLIAIFAIQNSMAVQVALLKWNIETSLVFVIWGAAFLGFLLALSLQIYSQIKLRLQLYQARSRIKQLEQDLTQIQQQAALVQSNTAAASDCHTTVDGKLQMKSSDTSTENFF